MNNLKEILDELDKLHKRMLVSIFYLGLFSGIIFTLITKWITKNDIIFCLLEGILVVGSLIHYEVVKRK